MIKIFNDMQAFQQSGDSLFIFTKHGLVENLSQNSNKLSLEIFYKSSIKFEIHKCTPFIFLLNHDEL